MFRKNYFSFLLSAVLLLTGSVAVFAQTAPVTGQIVLKKADGTTEPVAGALVEVFRTDVKAKFPSDKTDKRGRFAFAGLPLGATFVFSISAPNVKPAFFPNMRAGLENIVLTVDEGDGKRWSEDEVRSALTAPPQTTVSEPAEQVTVEDKKQKDEFEKKVADVEARNKKIENVRAIIDKSLAEGNQAFNNKNYDVAIVKFEEGYQANPEFVGTAPVLLNNKATALLQRAIDVYNQGVKATDTASRSQYYAKAQKDFFDAISAYETSWAVLKNAQAADIKDQQLYQTNKASALNGSKNVLKYIVLTERIDREKIPAVVTLVGEYMAFESDAAKKAEAEVYLADIYRITGDMDQAIAGYRKALEKSPDNPDALAGLGLSLANAGYNADGSVNDAMMQEAINNLQRFTEIAPDDHKLKASVKQTVDYLKTQNFKPEKTTRPTRKKS